MRGGEQEAQAAAPAPTAEAGVDPIKDAPVGHEGVGVRELLDVARDAARSMLEAEDALQLLRDRYELTENAEAQGELAVEALEQVERQLSLTRGRRYQLDSIEGQLWARRNRLERFLINTRGRAWWRARRSLAWPGNARPEVDPR